MKLRAYKFRLYPNKVRQFQLNSHLRAAQVLFNDCLALTKHLYVEYNLFPSQRTLQEISKTSGLYSQTAQVITHRLLNSIAMKVKSKKQGRHYGFPRFKPFERMKSLPYPQFGFRLNGKKLEVTPFGSINIKLHRKILGKIKTLTLKHEPSGKWFAIFAVEEHIAPEINCGKTVGIDLGLKNLAVLSDGNIVKNPRHIRKYEELLIKRNHKLSKKKKGSKNRLKAKLKLAKSYEKLKNSRYDFLHKLSHRLVHDYSMIALDKLDSKGMIEQRFGKSITDASWNMFANMLSYKAEGAGCRVVFVKPDNTTKMCSSCGFLSEKTLADRVHICPACGLSISRDLNAAINILSKATLRTAIRYQSRVNKSSFMTTAGMAGSNACGEETTTHYKRNEQVSSRKQEAGEI